jgi:hypothetical protein
MISFLDPLRVKNQQRPDHHTPQLANCCIKGQGPKPVMASQRQLNRE